MTTEIEFPDPERWLDNGETVKSLLGRVGDNELCFALLKKQGHARGYFGVPWFAFMTEAEIRGEMNKRGVTIDGLHLPQ